MLTTTISFFLLGLTFGSGPCIASCGPLLLSYLAGTKKNVAKSVLYYFLFSAARISVYLILGALVYFAGKSIPRGFLRPLGRYLFISSGIFIILLGILMILGKGQGKGICAYLHKKFLEQDKKSIFTLGIITGLAPCAPLIAVFSYIAVISSTWPTSVFYAFSFGAGTVVSPLFLLAVFSGFIPAIGSQKQEVFSRIFALLGGLIIVVLGLRMLFSPFYVGV